MAINSDHRSLFKVSLSLQVEATHNDYCHRDKHIAALTNTSQSSSRHEVSTVVAVATADAVDAAEKTFSSFNNVTLQRSSITDGSQIAFTTDHDKTYAINMTIIIHAIMYTLKHLLNFISSPFIVLLFAFFCLPLVLFTSHVPFKCLHAPYRIHSDHNNIYLIDTMAQMSIHHFTALISLLTGLYFAMGNFIMYNALQMHTIVVNILYTHQIYKIHFILTMLLSSLVTYSYTLTHGQVYTSIWPMNSIHRRSIGTFIKNILSLVSTHAIDAIIALVTAARCIILSAGRESKSLETVKTSATIDQSKVMSSVKYGRLTQLMMLILIVGWASRVKGADDLIDLSKKAIGDPKVITYPGDLNFALFIDGHESVDENMLKRNGRSFVDSSNDIRSLPTPSTVGSSSTHASSPMECSGKINSDGVLKAMSAIWAAHQVNIRRSRAKTTDAIKIGVSLFDSCSSPVVIQRQSVRMISSSLFSPITSTSNGKLCQASSGKTVQPIIFGALVDTDTETTSGPALSLLDSFSIPVITTSHIYSDILMGNNASDRWSHRKTADHMTKNNYPSLPKLSTRSSVFSVAPSLQSMAKGVISLLNRLTWSTATLVISDQIPNYYTDVFEEIASKVHFNVISSSSSSNNRMRTVPMTRRSDSNSSSKPFNTSRKATPLHTFSYPVSIFCQNSIAHSRLSLAFVPQESVKNTLLFLSSKESLQLLTSLKSNLPLPDSEKFNWILVTDSDISDKVKQLFSQVNTSLTGDKCISKSMLLFVPNTNVPTREFNKYFEHEISTFASLSVHPLVAKFSKQYLNDNEKSNENTNSTVTGKKRKKLLITSSEGLSLTIKSVWTLALALKQLEADHCTVNSLSKAACIERLTSKGLRDMITDTIRQMSNESLDGLGISSMENDKLTFNQNNVLKTNRFSLKVITSSCKIFDSGYYSDDNGLKVNEVLFTTLNVDQTSGRRNMTADDRIRSNLPLIVPPDNGKNDTAKGQTVVSSSRLFITSPTTPSTPSLNHRHGVSSFNRPPNNTGELFIMSNVNSGQHAKITPSDDDNSEFTESEGVRTVLNVNDGDGDDDDDDFDDNLPRSLPVEVNYPYANLRNVTGDKKRKRNSVSDSASVRTNGTRRGNTVVDDDRENNYHHTSTSSLSPTVRQRDTNGGKIVTSDYSTTSTSMPTFTDHSIAMFARLPSILTNTTSVGRQGRRGINNSPLNNAQSSTGKNNVVTRNTMPNYANGNTVTLNGQSSASTSLTSWLGRGWSLLILVASIIGSLITLYTFTFLLMKSCEGALGHNYRQSLIAINLLSIMLLFLGAMLYIFEPSPVLCTARRSAHNLSLCLLFGSLLIKSMYLRAYKTIGLGGQVNQINQFLTLIFIIAVQISIESHSWKVLTDWSSSPVASANLITNSIHNLCSPVAKDYINNQLYLLIVFILLLLFTWISRNEPLTTNEGSNLFTSTALISPVFITSIVLCEYFVPLTSADEVSASIAYLTSSRDTINGITMIIIGYITLCTIFVPILYSIHTYGTLMSGAANGVGPLGATYTDSSLSTAFTMFRGAFNGSKGVGHSHSHHQAHGHHGHSRVNHSLNEHSNGNGGALHHSPTDHRPILDNLSTSSATSSANHDYHINHSSPNRLLNAARVHAKQSANKKSTGHSKSFAGQLSHHLFSSSSSNHATKHDVHSHDDNGIHFSPCSNSYSYACNSPNCNFKLQSRPPGSGGPSPRQLHTRNHLGMHLISTSSSSHSPGNNGIASNPNGNINSPGNGAPTTGPPLSSRFPPGLFRNEIPTFNRFVSSSSKTRGVERDRGDHGTLITGVTYNRMNPLFESNAPNGSQNSGQIYRSAYP